uniref:Uncharacterized protein n=1 Tax=virus sp. ctML55 TaxID=2827627 RepID=A0A8S5RII7_9VIRU|nr:MAG TPA: hypothetical protein [virus sp. ctML55]
MLNQFWRLFNFSKEFIFLINLYHSVCSHTRSYYKWSKFRLV